MPTKAERHDYVTAVLAGVVFKKRTQRKRGVGRYQPYLTVTHWYIDNMPKRVASYVNGPYTSRRAAVKQALQLLEG